jgi:XrtJ-associated TM-motif-TM protein
MVQLGAYKSSHKIHPNKAHQVMKLLSRVSLVFSILLIPVFAHAQTGCLDSPECPTAVLALVGAAGAALYTRLRSR